MIEREKDLDSSTELTEEDEATLPALEPALEFAEAAPSCAAGRAALARHARLAPTSPGVYRMLDAHDEVLYVGKAKNLRKRVLAYTRPSGHDMRIARVIAATRAVEFITTKTETEALLLEANLIKRLRPRFNVLLRDDKSFPYILITSDHWAPQLLKHRGARTRPGDYYGPFASGWAVNRTLTALQRAFLLRSCSDGFFASRTRPCLLYQIKRCSAPCTQEIEFSDYAALVREANAFLSGKSQAVKEQLAAEMEKAAAALDFERAAVYRDRLAALSAVQAHQGINPRNVEDADVFAAHQEGGFTCIEVFFFRNGQNWGNHAYFPRADRALGTGEVLGAFLAQFYDDKPCPRAILLSDDIPERALLAAALSTKSGRKVEVAVPRHGEKRELVEHARINAREALGRKLADAASQEKLLAALAATFGLPRAPRRIEVYDNSHIQGSQAVGAMIVAGPEGFQKNQYRKFNIRSTELAPGDDYGMLREVLTRRFKRLLAEAPRQAAAEPMPVAGEGGPAALSQETSQEKGVPGTPTSTPLPSPPPQEGREEFAAPNGESPWPDLLLIDGGAGQLGAARAVLCELGLAELPVIAIAKGPERGAGNETFFMAGRAPFKLKARDPALYFVQRLRDEAHRFALGSHQARRKKNLREGGLEEIPGIGPARKRALLRHFGTLREIEQASAADLARAPGISREIARKIYDFFHGTPR